MNAHFLDDSTAAVIMIMGDIKVRLWLPDHQERTFEHLPHYIVIARDQLVRVEAYPFEPTDGPYYFGHVSRIVGSVGVFLVGQLFVSPVLDDAEWQTIWEAP